MEFQNNFLILFSYFLIRTKLVLPMIIHKLFNNIFDLISNIHSILLDFIFFMDEIIKFFDTLIKVNFFGLLDRVIDTIIQIFHHLHDATTDCSLEFSHFFLNSLLLLGNEGGRPWRFRFLGRVEFIVFGEHFQKFPSLRDKYWIEIALSSTLPKLASNYWSMKQLVHMIPLRLADWLMTPTSRVSCF